MNSIPNLLGWSREDVKRSRRLAEALSAVERGDLHTAMSEGHAGSVVGVVGPPGVGKSSLISALVERARHRGQSVVVLAVDPSSPVTGGALLGDRVRMGAHVTDPGTFIRSFASRGHPGGLASAIPSAIAVALDQGWDRVFIEPVGGGQNDTDVAAIAGTVLLLVSPESGDDVQVLKAGILELAHVVAVNKADRPEAAAFLGVLRRLWHPPPGGACVLVSALHGSGVDELDAAIQHHASQLSPTGLPGVATGALVNDIVALARAALAEPAVRGRVAHLLHRGRRTEALRHLLAQLPRG